MATRVIIAEAGMAIRQMLARIISAEGYDVVGEAATGEEAIRLCERLTCGILVLEAHIPGVPGCEVLRRLQARRDAVKVLVFSDTGNSVRVRQMLLEHPDAFVGKNDPLSSLLEALRALACGQIYISPAAAPFWKTTNESTEQPLTAREVEVIQLVARSLSSKEIAARLGLALKTVENHRARLMDKLHSRNSAGLTRYAIQHGLVSFD